MVSCNLNRIYFIAHKGTQIRQAQTINKNSHIERRKLAITSRLQLAWEEEELMLRIQTAAAEQRCRNIAWDIGEHNVYREVLGLVLEMVNISMERSEENKANKNFSQNDDDAD